MSASTPMPRYKCHKEVWALKLGAAEVLEDGSVKIAPADPRYAVQTMSPEWGTKFHGGKTNDPGYLVVYDDGYESWSPTKPFEDGYIRI